MDTATAALLVSDEGQVLLRELPAYREGDVLPLGARLRKEGHDPALIAAAMTQSRLRAKATAKFGDFAEGMLFTEPGLEQATRLQVAAHHARRFRDAGIESVADLTCGIGADAMAFSALGIAVMAFELDEATAMIADHNLRHWESSVVVCADSVATVPRVAVDGLFADPARRNPRGRRHDPEDYEPSLTSVLALREQFPALGVKVGPGIAHDALPGDVESQWVSVDGDVVEAALWCGPLARLHGRSAMLLGKRGTHVLDATGVEAEVGPVSEYLYEPDGAVIRSGQVAECAALVGGHLADATIAYVHAPRRIETPFATPYRVLDVMPFSAKVLKSYLRERDVGRVTIKKRGTSVTPEALRAQLALKGREEATVILTRVAGAQRMFIVEPAAGTAA